MVNRKPVLLKISSSQYSNRDDDIDLDEFLDNEKEKLVKDNILTYNDFLNDFNHFKNIYAPLYKYDVKKSKNDYINMMLEYFQDKVLDEYILKKHTHNYTKSVFDYELNNFFNNNKISPSYFNITNRKLVDLYKNISNEITDNLRKISLEKKFNPEKVINEVIDDLVNDYGKFGEPTGKELEDLYYDKLKKLPKEEAISQLEYDLKIDREEAEKVYYYDIEDYIPERDELRKKYKLSYEDADTLYKSNIKNQSKTNKKISKKIGDELIDEIINEETDKLFEEILNDEYLDNLAKLRRESVIKTLIKDNNLTETQAKRKYTDDILNLSIKDIIENNPNESDEKIKELIKQRTNYQPKTVDRVYNEYKIKYEGNGLKGKGISDIVDRFTNIFTNKKSSALDKYENKYGDYLVKHVFIHRKPVDSEIKKLLSIVSLGKFDDVYKYYDEIYHLYVIVNLHHPQSKDKVFLKMEKRPNITIEKVNYGLSKDDQHIEQAVLKNITYKQMIDKIKMMDGDNLYTYSPEKYNCQQFIISLLHSLDINHVDKWVYQDKIGDYITGHTKEIANKITDTGHIFNRIKALFTGEGRKRKRGGGDITDITNPILDIATEGLNKVPIVGDITKPISENAVNVINSILGIKSKLLPSAQFNQTYGTNFKNVLLRYGPNSDPAIEFQYYYPERLTDQLYLYNTPFDSTSGYLNGYPQNVQDLYLYSANIPTQKNYLQNMMNKAKQLGLTWSSPDDKNVQAVQRLGIIHSTLSTTGHY